MNQYIITEELLEKVIRGDIIALREVRSRPYNPQAEQFTKDELSDLFIIVDADIERHGKGTTTMKLLHKIEELRKGES